MVKWQCRHRNLSCCSGKSTSWRCVQVVIVPLLLAFPRARRARHVWCAALVGHPLARLDSHALDLASEPERAMLLVDLPAHWATAVEANIEPLVEPNHERRRQSPPTGGILAIREEASAALALARGLVVQHRLMGSRR